MQERQITEIRFGTPAIRLTALQPSLRSEFTRIGTPLCRRVVDGPGSDDDHCIFRDGVVENCGVVGGDAHRHGDGREVSEDLVDAGV